ncbi:DUF1761 domain-containing protein [Fibrisoma montanum]|uniref:DUF1761 domain-containing protein n=1 Tax=Fibrisoma montanum TaxID=2305895 RepID=A0A418LXD8_9BACT|nr:DUF1761 domain-containing protein [Fibrisoma montanum]RIV17919.1 DUF1761 domain-containing protein [Fibrisoma montanum]
MFTVLSAINWFSVVVAFVVYFMLGGLWYTKLFPQAYKVSLGKANQTLNNQSPLYIVGPALCVLVILLASTVLMYALDIHSYGSALLFALFIGMGFLVSNTTNIAINPNIPRPFLYSVITGTYHLVGITLACLILVAMR